MSISFYLICYIFCFVGVAGNDPIAVLRTTQEPHKTEVIFLFQPPFVFISLVVHQLQAFSKLLSSIFSTESYPKKDDTNHTPSSLLACSHKRSAMYFTFFFKPSFNVVSLPCLDLKGVA